MSTAEYDRYLRSAEWRGRREECLRSYGHRCQVCGCTEWRRLVDVHHLHYRNVGRELPEDLVPLCSAHHGLIHAQPDGFGEEVLRRLRREATEDHWSDPLPASLRDHFLRVGDSTMQCGQCFAQNEYEQDRPYCRACDASLVLPPPGERNAEPPEGTTAAWHSVGEIARTRPWWPK